LKKHGEFESRVSAQSEFIKVLLSDARNLVSAGHFDTDAIESRRQAIESRWNTFQDAVATRRDRLQESLRYFEFSRQADDVQDAIRDMMATACDESYRDPSNLLGKVKSHDEFCTKMAAHQTLYQSTLDTGRHLCAENHFRSREIQQRLAELEKAWLGLTERVEEKSRRLGEAKDQLTYSQGVEECLAWMTEMETTTASDDFGRDLASVQHLLKRQEMLESEVEAQQEVVEAARRQALQFQYAGHFDAEGLASKQKALSERYERLQEPLRARRERLQEQLELFQFLHSVDAQES
jgi:spectrin alpha